MQFFPKQKPPMPFSPQQPLAKLSPLLHYAISCFCKVRFMACGLCIHSPQDWNELIQHCLHQLFQWKPLLNVQHVLNVS